MPRMMDQGSCMQYIGGDVEKWLSRHVLVQRSARRTDGVLKRECLHNTRRGNTNVVLPFLIRIMKVFIMKFDVPTMIQGLQILDGGKIICRRRVPPVADFPNAVCHHTCKNHKKVKKIIGGKRMVWTLVIQMMDRILFVCGGQVGVSVIMASSRGLHSHSHGKPFNVTKLYVPILPSFSLIIMPDSDNNLNAQVLASLNRLAATLAQLDETKSVQPRCAVEDELVKGTSTMSLTDNGDIDNTLKNSSVLPTRSISHWRTLPPEVTSAHQLLADGASYIHATSTKYTLISNTGHNQESGNLAVELRKGAEFLGTGSLLLFSASCGASRSLKHYVKLNVRAVVATVLNLLQYFEDRNAGVVDTKNNSSNIGAQKTGAIWSACDKLISSLPRGNRAAMRRDLMVWMQDCNETIVEFEALMSLGPKILELDLWGEDKNDDDEDDNDEQYTASELKLAKATVNLMKCSKNVLNLVMSACECVGERLEGLSSSQEEDKTKREDNHKERKEMLQYIADLHDKARTIGVGVSDLGVILYPPFEMEIDIHTEDVIDWLSKKSQLRSNVNISNLVNTTLGLELDRQLHALLDCVESVHHAEKTYGFTSIEECMSKDVVEASERLLKAVHVRCQEIEKAIYW